MMGGGRTRGIQQIRVRGPLPVRLDNIGMVAKQSVKAAELFTRLMAQLLKGLEVRLYRQKMLVLVMAKRSL